MASGHDFEESVGTACSQSRTFGRTMEKGGGNKACLPERWREVGDLPPEVGIMDVPWEAWRAAGGKGHPGCQPRFLHPRSPHDSLHTHTHSPGAHRPLSAARSCSHRLKFHQLSTLQKGGVLLMHHSFHRGGHLAGSPSPGVLLHDCPPFPYRGLCRALEEDYRPGQHHSPNSA